MKYKIGDKVTIEDDSGYDEALSSHGLLCAEADSIKSMRMFCNKDATITDIDRDGDYILDIDKGVHCWDASQFIEKDTK